MSKSWQDPDTGVVHAIAREGEKDSAAWHHVHETPGLGLLKLPREKIGQHFFRRVTMCCGLSVKTDSDESIVSETKLGSLSIILRPWRTARDAPTCVVCASHNETTGIERRLGRIRGL